MFDRSKSLSLADASVAAAEGALERQLERHTQLTTYLIGALAASLTMSVIALGQHLTYAWDGAIFTLLAASLVIWRTLMAPYPNIGAGSDLLTPLAADSAEDFVRRRAKHLVDIADDNESSHVKRLEGCYEGHAWLTAGIFLIAVALSAEFGFSHDLPGALTFVLGIGIAVFFAIPAQQFGGIRLRRWRRFWTGPLLVAIVLGVGPALLSAYKESVLHTLNEGIVVVLLLVAYGMFVILYGGIDAATWIVTRRGRARVQATKPAVPT